MSDSENACWICLSSEGPLSHPCRCPEDRVVHKKCLARWQLQSAGKSEEHCCRFCQAPYPDWKATLTPANLNPAIPVVSVQYNGATYRLRVKPGPKGLATFQKQLQAITGLSALDCMQITFQCRAPDNSQELNFRGISAFDAAMHCASISAAERLATRTLDPSSSARPSLPAVPPTAAPSQPPAVQSMPQQPPCRVSRRWQLHDPWPPVQGQPSTSLPEPVRVPGQVQVQDEGAQQERTQRSLEVLPPPPSALLSPRLPHIRRASLAASPPSGDVAMPASNLPARPATASHDSGILVRSSVGLPAESGGSHPVPVQITGKISSPARVASRLRSLCTSLFW